MSENEKIARMAYIKIKKAIYEAHDYFREFEGYFVKIWMPDIIEVNRELFETKKFERKDE